ncbi:MAG: hypothetical protein AABY27_06405 [Pseudomonadota bacterium]
MNLNDIIAFASFEDFNKSFENDVALIGRPIDKYKLCMNIAQLYKHIARIDGIREEARRGAIYFSNLAMEYLKIAQCDDGHR